MTSDQDLARIGASLDGIGHVLRDHRLEVPAYQRPYSWELEQVEAFWGDLRRVMAEFLAAEN